MDYEKTNWVDGVTLVNAEKLNKIENAIQELADTSLMCSNLKGEGGIKISSSCGNVIISQESSSQEVLSTSIVMEDGSNFENWLRDEVTVLKAYIGELREQIKFLKEEIEAIKQKFEG